MIAFDYLLLQRFPSALPPLLFALPFDTDYYASAITHEPRSIACLPLLVPTAISPFLRQYMYSSLYDDMSRRGSRAITYGLIAAELFISGTCVPPAVKWLITLRAYFLRHEPMPPNTFPTPAPQRRITRAFNRALSAAKIPRRQLAERFRSVSEGRRASGFRHDWWLDWYALRWCAPDGRILFERHDIRGDYHRRSPFIASARLLAAHTHTAFSLWYELWEHLEHDTIYSL